MVAESTRNKALETAAGAKLCGAQMMTTSDGRQAYQFSDVDEGIETLLVKSSTANGTEKRNRRKVLFRRIMQRNKMPSQESSLNRRTIVLSDGSDKARPVIHSSVARIECKSLKSQNPSESIEVTTNSHQQVIANDLLAENSKNEAQSFVVKANSFLDLHATREEKDTCMHELSTRALSEGTTAQKQTNVLPDCVEWSMFGVFDRMCDGEELPQARDDILFVRSSKDDERHFDSPYAYTLGTLTGEPTLSSLDDSGSLYIFMDDDDTYTSGDLRTPTNDDSRIGMGLDSNSLLEAYSLINDRDTRYQARQTQSSISSAPTDWSSCKLNDIASHDYSGSTITSIYLSSK